MRQPWHASSVLGLLRSARPSPQDERWCKPLTGVNALTTTAAFQVQDKWEVRWDSWIRHHRSPFFIRRRHGRRGRVRLAERFALSQPRGGSFYASGRAGAPAAETSPVARLGRGDRFRNATANGTNAAANYVPPSIVFPLRGTTNTVLQLRPRPRLAFASPTRFRRPTPSRLRRRNGK